MTKQIVSAELAVAIVHWASNKPLGLPDPEIGNIIDIKLSAKDRIEKLILIVLF